MRHKRLLILVMFLIAAACLSLWLSTSGGVSDFGLNAFTETLGILVTVLIVDHLIKRQEELRSLPQKATAYEDVRLLTSRIVTFWSEVHHACVPEPSPSSVSDLFCQSSFEKMRRYLNLDARPNVTPSRTWWDWIPQGLSDHKNRADTILERHNNVLDPVAYAYIHQIAGGIDPGIMYSLRQSDQEMGFPRPHVLGSYFFPSEGHFQAITSLVEWCEEQVKHLENKGIVGLKRVVTTIGPWDRQENPPSMISERELIKQVEAMQRVQRATATTVVAGK